MRKLKVGIVGCGRISVVYKKAFERLSDGIDVVCAMDKVKERAQGFAKEFGAKYTDKFEDILKQDLDVIHICTPHFLHKDQVVRSLEAGFNVLTEKPMAITLADADVMIETAKRTGKKLGVIFQNRYIEGVREMKRVITSGEIGKVIGAWSHLTWWRPPSYYECDWKGSWEKEGGGVLIDQAIHSIDLVQWLVGSPVEWIHGHIDNRILKVVEVEDVADAAVKFENGCVYCLYACNYYTHSAPIQIEITGEKGSVHLKGFTATIKTGDREYTVEPKSDGTPGESYWGNYHYEQIKEYYDSIIEDKPIPVDGSEGRKALEIVLGVYQSSRENKKIYINE